MLSNIRELFRWILFIPIPFIAGPLVSSLLLIFLLLVSKSLVGSLVDIPTKIILTSTMWVVIYWIASLHCKCTTFQYKLLENL